ncbi:methionyl-tRNA formyltransferase [Streptomyces pacificus]|uniref:Methionyl-tRNA formyltransferase n=1 Tax=Streptomyces pacificus TaxID=2705029 RepID=A0A6A0B1N7_9ACTN|nr:methionyl-tRNA formyltransferase [Streptomyces pacificus]GFH38511.1 methionyl-tRNA formyltransferase [Streptomyces pacificus]
MRVVMFGYQTWGHRTLKALLDSEHDVATVVTHPKSEHAYEKIWSDSVAELAEEHGIPVVIRNRPDDEELFDLLKSADPDIIVANNWRTWIPPRIYGLPRHGTLNIHDSLLPKYAGFSPIIWAMINGESEVGVTAHLMDEVLDAGDIVEQRAVAVEPTDTATDLFHKTVALIAPVAIGALARIAAGETEFTKQDRSQATFFHKRSEKDIHVNWDWPAEVLERLVRAQSAPYPAAFTFHKGKRLEILAAVVSEGRYGGTPGRIFYREDDGVVIVAGADARTGRNHGLAITRVRTEDGSELPATEYFTSLGGYLTSRP